jgi:hypothetical protein
VKFIRYVVAFLSLNSWDLAGLNAQTLDFLFDQTTTKECTFDHSLDCQRLVIENLGKRSVKNILPYIDKPLSLSPEQLIEQLAHEKYPLVALYHFWNQSVLVNDQLEMSEEHPLNLLNFKGYCSSQAYVEEYIKLCHLLGFNLRLANVKNRPLFDFACQENEWQLFDIQSQKFYLGWDNETLLSSEDLMDDPLLALRTKNNRTQEVLDVKKNWEQLAQFDILYPQQAAPLLLEMPKWIDHVQGFTLYPQEKLVFQTPISHEGLDIYTRRAEHTLHLDQRQAAASSYKSPFPIHSIENQGEVPVRLVGQQVTLQPGEILLFNQDNLFQIYFKFEETTNNRLMVTSTFAWSLFPSFQEGNHQLHLGSQKNESLVRLSCEMDENTPYLPTQVQVVNQTPIFDFCTPEFQLSATGENPEKIWWQISPEKNFNFVPTNFDSPQAWTPVITLPLLSETLLNPDQTYYFRIKSYQNKQWSEWSSAFAFKVHKPDAVLEVNFEKIDDKHFEINWERYAEENPDITYLVFGSNALDFIPSIYEKNQINALVNGEVLESEFEKNLVAITTEPKLIVNGHLAYYRILAQQNGKISNPSALVHVYDDQLIQPRHVLQAVNGETKRQLIPSSYPWNQVALPLIGMPAPNLERDILKTKNLFEAQTATTAHGTAVPYEVNPYVSAEIWERVRPYFLPENHPIRPKMDRLFRKHRVIQTPEDFKKAGFKRFHPGHWSRVMASAHPELQGYFIKAFADTELRIKNDWLKWLHRIEGAESIRACINRHHYRSLMKVPHKWIYPLPIHPSPPENSRYLRKNFILVAEDMRIEEHSKNNKLYRKKMTPKLMEAVYTVYQEEGLYDSVYPFNVPFCKDGKLAFIDTEFHHRWPVPFHKLTSHFSSELRNYWTQLTHNGGAIAQPESTRPHPPRQD